MVKQKAIVPEELAVTAAKAAVAEPADRSAAAFPPPRSAGLGICCTKRLLSQLDISGAGDAGTTAWVDSMQASSPTHVKAAAALSASFAASHEEEYDNWLKQHPSALRDFDDIVAASKGKKVVMFLDYDGTLSPIVDDPDVAFMSDAMRKAVRDIARIFPTAIVSGRCREKVFDFVRLSELYYAGSHGLDIQGPTTRTKHTKANAKAVSFQPASEFLPMVDEVYKALAEKTKDIKEARVENNTFSLSVHFRCVNEDEYCLLAEVVWSVLKGYPKLRLTFGRKVLEIRPSIEWDKGKALEFLLESLGFANCNNVFPVYIGDDRTDEDAFKVLHDRKQGLGILVSKFAKETNASYSLQEPAEVKEFLRRLVEWKRLPFKKRCKGIIN